MIDNADSFWRRSIVTCIDNAVRVLTAGVGRSCLTY